MQAFSVLYALFLTACAVDDLSTSRSTQHVTSDNGVSLNGVSLNGVSLNGVSLNGVRLNGVSLNGVSLNGSTWSGLLSSGAVLALQIDDAATGTGTNLDVGLFAVSYETGAGRVPLCGLDATGAPIRALAVPGSWSATAAYTESATEFTFACRGTSVAKCVELGYKPWSGYGDQLASCVRMLRGDYCGDGESHTANGTVLNFYDNVGVQLDTEAWVVEGEWTPAGARCVTKDANTRYLQRLVAPRPACLETLVHKSCGKTFADGTVLVSELPKPR